EPLSHSLAGSDSFFKMSGFDNFLGKLNKSPSLKSCQIFCANPMTLPASPESFACDRYSFFSSKVFSGEFLMLVAFYFNGCLDFTYSRSIPFVFLNTRFQRGCFQCLHAIGKRTITNSYSFIRAEYGSLI